MRCWWLPDAPAELNRGLGPRRVQPMTSLVDLSLISSVIRVATDASCQRWSVVCQDDNSRDAGDLAHSEALSDERRLVTRATRNPTPRATVQKMRPPCVRTLNPLPPPCERFLTTLDDRSMYRFYWYMPLRTQEPQACELAGFDIRNSRHHDAGIRIELLWLCAQSCIMMVHSTDLIM
jgi:hypothetical protein